MEDATLEHTPAIANDRGALSAIAFGAPWLVVSLLLPEPLRYVSLALVTALIVLLIGAARWSWARATERGLDPVRWAFLATVTFGASMIALLMPARMLAESRMLDEGIACGECGRVQLASEAFCFGCGAS